MYLNNNRFAPVKSDSEIRSHEKSYRPGGIGVVLFLLIVLAVIVILTFIFGGEAKVATLPLEHSFIQNLNMIKESLVI